MSKNRVSYVVLGYAVMLLAACSGSETSDGNGVPREGIGDGQLNGIGASSGHSGAAAPTGSGSDSFSSGAAGGSASAPVPIIASGTGGSSGSPGAEDDSAAIGRESTPGGGDGSLQSGILTAGAWDDNRNFERFTQFRKDQLQMGLPGLLPTSDAEHADAHTLFTGTRAARKTLDVSLVIDTTGSMGDEIAYLHTEFLAISKRIESEYPDAQQRWSLVVYKDDGDEYVVRWFDFRDDANDFRTNLIAQSASGGGDFPESPDKALAAMNQLAWRTGSSTARIAFWVADAPHHDEVADKMADAIRSAAKMDIHIYPVASSGIDAMTELTMRTAAQLTGGRYLFLTDDSGVGGSHLEPSIPCYFVTRLDAAIVRMVDIELSGKYQEPAAKEIVRNGGEPQDGACTLESGDEVLVF